MIFQTTDKIFYKVALPEGSAEAIDRLKERLSLKWGGYIADSRDGFYSVLFEVLPEAKREYKEFKADGAAISRNVSIKVCAASITGKDRAWACMEELKANYIDVIYEYNIGASLKKEFMLYVKESDAERAGMIAARLLSELPYMARLSVPYKGNNNALADMDRAFKAAGLNVRRGYKHFFCGDKDADACVKAAMSEIRKEHVCWAEWHGIPINVEHPKVKKPKKAKDMPVATEPEPYQQMDIFQLIQDTA